MLKTKLSLVALFTLHLSANLIFENQALESTKDSILINSSVKTIEAGANFLALFGSSASNISASKVYISDLLQTKKYLEQIALEDASKATEINEFLKIFNPVSNQQSSIEGSIKADELIIENTNFGSAFSMISSLKNTIKNSSIESVIFKGELNAQGSTLTTRSTQVVNASDSVINDEGSTFLSNSLSNSTITANKSIFNDSFNASKTNNIKAISSTFNADIYAKTLDLDNTNDISRVVNIWADEVLLDGFDILSAHIYSGGKISNIINLTNLVDSTNKALELNNVKAFEVTNSSGLSLINSSVANAHDLTLSFIDEFSSINATKNVIFKSNSINGSTITSANSIYEDSATNAVSKAARIDDTGSTFNGSTYIQVANLTDSKLIDINLFADELNAIRITSNAGVISADAASFESSLIESNYNGVLIAKDSIFTKNINSLSVTATNSYFANAFTTDNLNATNSYFTIGATSFTYIQALISKQITTGSNNSILLLGLVENNKINESLIENKLLAKLKIGSGNANLDTFFTNYYALSGIDKYVLDSKYIYKEKIGDYLVYLLGNNLNNASLDGVVIDEHNIATTGNIVNKDINNEGLLVSFKDIKSGVVIDSLATELTPPKEPNEGTNSEVTNPQLPDNSNSVEENKPNPDIPSVENKPNDNANSETNIPILPNEEGKELKVLVSNEVSKELQGLFDLVNYGFKFNMINYSKNPFIFDDLANNHAFYMDYNFAKAKNIDLSELKINLDRRTFLDNKELFTGIKLGLSEIKNDSKVSNYYFGLSFALAYDNGVYLGSDLAYTYNQLKFKNILIDNIDKNYNTFNLSFNLAKKYEFSNIELKPYIGFILSNTSMEFANKDILIDVKNKTNEFIKAGILSTYKINNNFAFDLGFNYLMALNDLSYEAKSKNTDNKIIFNDKLKSFIISTGVKYNLSDSLDVYVGYEKGLESSLKINNQFNFNLKYTF